ncbi:putative transmembrane protein [Leptomonas pyrrhocoris]|uniref:Putative transmembrane protein n=1 Tax=Leptomonas pyrrhocoris TaxID=157538 RepID=A0A0M9FPT4_LEPPY|nr:putative transmembrane protein [Leptomonas pyrrhocoris]KPA73449.1 putative transmembrane protein [Leptomonas pyrrhocoris]|eukprot:XP_015651888.1 putative transmembrane protein [Leptomonas pyrrhocoris]
MTSMRRTKPSRRNACGASLFCCCLLLLVLHSEFTPSAIASSLSSKTNPPNGGPSSSSSSQEVNSTLCPGITLEGCSDDACLSFGASNCPERCLYNAVAQRCVGLKSCLLNSCSGHGLCELNSTVAPSCRCAADYYGTDCDAICNEESCADAYGVIGLACSAEGTCHCPDHFTPLSRACSKCEDGWYGVLCDLSCPCGGHGNCDRETRACHCFRDPGRGYWDGDSCTHCLASYMGDDCTTPNALFTALPHAVMYLSFPTTSFDDRGPLTLQWSGSGQLIVSRGAAVLCGEVSVMNRTGIERAVFLPTQAPHITPRVIRSSTLFRNGTVALLGAGPRVGDDASSSPHDGGDLMGVSVLHCTASLSTNDCVLMMVEDYTLTPVPLSSSAGVVDVVDARIAEEWGWALLLSSGLVVLHKHLSDIRLLQLPADFTATSVHIDETGGVVFVAGATGGRWSVYATHSGGDGGTGFVEVSFSNATSGDPFVQTGVAWQVNVSGSHMYATGSSASSSSEAWVLAGTLRLANDRADIAVSVCAFSTVAIGGEPRAISLFSSDVDSFTTLLIVVQTDAEAATFVWVMDNAAAPSQLELRNAQDITAVLDGEADVFTTYVWANGLLLFSQASSTGVVVHPFTGYSVTSIAPSLVVAAGLTPLTLTGIFLMNGIECVSEAHRAPAVTANSTVMQCSSLQWPEAKTCAPVSVEASMPGTIFTATTDNRLPLQRYPSVLLTAIYGVGTTGAYASVFSEAPIFIFGQGFVNTSGLECVYVDSERYYRSRGHYLSSQQILCDFPAEVDGPTVGNTGSFSVSLNGHVLSDPLRFTFIGEAAGLAVLAPAAPFTVVSAAYVGLPSIDVVVVDSEGHPLRELDRNRTTDVLFERVVQLSAPWFVSTRKEVARHIDPASSLVVLAYSNKTLSGATSFTVVLQYPLVGVGQLTFSSAGLASANWTYWVEEGAPHTMEVAVQPSPLLNNHHTNASRQPVIVFRDIAGNIVGDQNELRVMTRGSVAVAYFDGVAWTSQVSQPVSENGYFNFTSVYPEGLFGNAYQMTFMAENFSNVSSDVMTTGACYGDEYGRYDTTSCLPCPDHATCNGSYVFNVTDGYWKGGEVAYDIYRCSRPRVCRAGRCATGYTGVLCGVCDAGYGLTGSQCAKCFSTAANVVLVVLLIVCVPLVPLFLTFLTFQVFGPHFSVVHGARAILDFVQLIGLVLLPMPELPDYVGRFVVFTRLLSTGDALMLSPFNCLFTSLVATEKFAVEVVAVAVILAVLFIVLLYGDVRFARHFEALRKRRWFLSLLAPFTSEEAYHNRLAELGLDEERALGSTVTTDTLDPNQRTIREAYTLIDSNRYAISAVSQLPNSAVRESALESLLAEQEELQRFLRQYEAHVSCGGPPPGRDGTDAAPATAAPPTAAPSSASASRTAPLVARGGGKAQAVNSAVLSATAFSTGLGATSTTAAATEGLSASEAAARRTPAEALGGNGESNDANTADAAGGKGEDQGPASRRRGSASSSSGHSPPPPSMPSSHRHVRNAKEEVNEHGQSNEDGHRVDESDPDTPVKAALQRFGDVTPTPFSLFGAHEPFKPTAAPLDFLQPQLLPATEQVAPQRQSTRASTAFLWPRFQAQAVMLGFTVYHYFYVAVVEYSFALVRCDDTTMSAVDTDGAEAVTTSRLVSYVSLVADRRVNCQSDTFASYRVAGLVLGSLFSAALPLALLWLSLWGPRSSTTRASGVAYVRECCVAILGLSEDFLWWEAVSLLYKWALVLMRNLIPSSNVAGLVIGWSVLAFCTVLVYLQPFYDFFPQSLQVISWLSLTVTASLQMLPLLHSATMVNGVSNIPTEMRAAQHGSGVLVVALPCVTLAVLLFVVWAVTFSRQRWRRLGNILFALGGGVEVHNILHFFDKRRTAAAATAAKAVPTGWQAANGAVPFSFVDYNLRLVRQAGRCDTADGAEETAVTAVTLEDQIAQAVRGKAAGKGSRHGDASLWANWGVVGGLAGMANHVSLFSRFIQENGGAVPREGELAAATAATGSAKESSTRVDAARESVAQPSTVMDKEVGDELLTMCEHLRQLEHFVLQMEKELDRRTAR